MPNIDVNGTNLHYRFDGPEQGQVVMLSNSLASTLAMWEPQIAPLTGAGYRVLRYDSRGHGLSASPEGPYTIEQLAGDVVALMDGLGLARVHFCGLSIGGMVGQMLGTHYGDRLISLTLCDTAAQMPPKEMWDDRITAVRAAGIASLADGLADLRITKSGQTRLPEEVNRIREMIVNTPAEGFCACCAAIRDMDQRASIRAIATPTKIIVGDQDVPTPVTESQFIHEQVTASTLTVFPDAAHQSNLEQAEAFNATLLGFLQQRAAA